MSEGRLATYGGLRGLIYPVLMSRSWYLNSLVTPWYLTSAWVMPGCAIQTNLPASTRTAGLRTPRTGQRPRRSVCYASISPARRINLKPTGMSRGWKDAKPATLATSLWLLNTGMLETKARFLTTYFDRARLPSLYASGARWSWNQKLVYGVSELQPETTSRTVGAVGSSGIIEGLVSNFMVYQ